MRLRNESPAVAVARAHAEAWSNHDFDTARSGLAHDVHITVTTTQPIMAPTDTVGVDDYMEGLVKFAQIIEPGSLWIIESLGDERNALLVVNVQTLPGPGGEKASLTGARLYLIDENGKIKAEQVIFFMTPG